MIHKNEWETPDSIPARDAKLKQFSEDVEVLIPEMDAFGVKREVKRKGYYHLQAHQWFVFNEDNTSEEPCDSVLAWRYIS
jgi:hypothetical protein